MSISNTFPLHTFLSRSLRIVGWLAVALGVVYCVAFGIVEPILHNHRFSPENAFNLASGLAVAVAGVVLAWFGEALGVIYAIEANTRRTAELLSAS